MSSDKNDFEKLVQKSTDELRKIAINSTDGEELTNLVLYANKNNYYYF